MNMYLAMTILDLLALSIGLFRIVRTSFYYIIPHNMSDICFGFVAVLSLGIIGQLHSLVTTPNNQWLFKCFGFAVGVLAIHFSKNVRSHKK